MIAVIGYAARTSGADDADEFWALVQSAVPQFAPVPYDRWNGAAYFSTELSEPFTYYTQSMAAIDDPYGWDRKHFGIPVARARCMDPQQRMALTLAREVFLRAELSHAALAGRQIGCVLGVSSNDYRLLSSAAIPARMLVDGSMGAVDADLEKRVRIASTNALHRQSAYSLAGLLNNIIPAVIQSQWDLRGPAFAVDSACSSALTAIHQACNLIQLGEVESCLAGGIYLVLTPDTLVGFSAMGAISRTGTVASFYSDADGFTLGEGGALLLLKSLDRALMDGDRIFAVLEGWGSSSDGRAPGVMTPTIAGQQLAIREAMRRAGDGEFAVDFVEGHGTGTVIGDAAEIKTLIEVRGMPRLGDPARIPLGSVKAVVGHTLSASGALSAVKAVKMLESGAIPPQPPRSSAPNELLRESGFRLATGEVESSPLQRIGINSFGFGGSNTHLIVGAPEKGLDR